MSRLWLTVILLLCWSSLVACGGGGGDEQGAVGTPADGFTITGSLFESEQNGYQVRFPEAWTPKPNFLPASAMSVDAFFAPDVVDAIQPNIVITREGLPEGMGLQEYFDSKMDIVKKVVQVEPEVSSRQVSGKEALVGHYRRENAEPPLEKVEVYFIADGSGWGISLTMPLGRSADYQGLFEGFLQSFLVLR